jgi:hypothetical protein
MYQEERMEGVEEFKNEIRAEFMDLMEETRTFFKNCTLIDLIGK